jgi:capsular exopolysaccharide synthesis family protein
MNAENNNLSIHFLDYWRVIRMRLPLVILVFLLVVITTAVITYLMPREYASTVTLEVREGGKVLNVFGNAQRDGFDPRFVTTQFEIIQRKEILYPVIERLGLEKAWRDRLGLVSMAQVYNKLQRMITVKEIRNTQLIQLIVMSTDKQEAMKIANAIAEEYQKKRISEEQALSTRSLDRLKSEVEKEAVKVDDLKKEVSRIRIEDGIIDLNPEGVEEVQQLPDRVLLVQEEQVGTARLEASKMRAKYEEISKLSDEEIMRSLVTMDREVQDPTVVQILPLYLQTSAELRSMENSGYGPNHPRLLALTAKKAEMENQLLQQAAVVRKTLETNMIISEQSLKAMEARLDESRGTSTGSRTKSAAYYDAKTNYIEAKKVLEAARLSLSTQTMQQQMPQSPAAIWEYAEVSDSPARPRVMLNMILGVFVGLVMGIGLAFFVEYLDTSVKTMEDVENFLKVPVLAVVPKNIGLLMHEPPNTVDAEAYRIMRTNIEFNRKTTEGNSFTFASGGASEGKSTTLNNLAFTFARGGYKTLVIDADLRRPSQHRVFRIEPTIGLSDYLAKDIDMDEAVVSTPVENLYFMSCGSHPADAQGILNTKKMVDLIEEAKKRYDLLFIDSPPILGVSDASLLASSVDFTIIVVQHRRFPRSMLQRVKQSVVNVGGRIIGVVLNNVDIRDDMPYQYYTNYYTYQTKRDSKKRKDGKEGERKEYAAARNDRHSDY